MQTQKVNKHTATYHNLWALIYKYIISALHILNWLNPKQNPKKTFWIDTYTSCFQYSWN